MKNPLLRYKAITAIFILIAISSSCTEDDLGPLRNPVEEVPIEYTWAATADSMQNATFDTYLTTNGTFRQDNEGGERFHYWWNAHVLDVMVDGYLRTQDAKYIPRMKALVEGIKLKNGGNFPNDFNDDMQWLAIACTRAYEVTQDVYYKEVAELLWEEIKKGWSDDIHGGGIIWTVNAPNGKNATSNAPGAILALRLYAIDGDEDDLEWAKKIFAWQKSTLVDPVTGLVWDNIDMVEGEVVINKDWVFTYNIGTYIGAATELYKVTEDEMYLNDAVKTATSMMTSQKLITNGLLRDEGQGDGGLFKGILIRYFTKLILLPDLSEDNRDKFVDFFKFNAQSFYEKAISRPSMLSSPNWGAQPGATIDLSTQLSGVMLMEAAAKLKEEEIL